MPFSEGIVIVSPYLISELEGFATSASREMYLPLKSSSNGPVKIDSAEHFPILPVVIFSYVYQGLSA